MVLTEFTSTAPFLGDFPDDAVFGSTSFKVIYDGPGRDAGIPGVTVFGTEHQVQFATADAPTLAENDTITFRSTDWIVRQVGPLGDGIFSQALLKKVG